MVVPLKIVKTMSATDVTKLDISLEKSAEAVVANRNNTPAETVGEEHVRTGGIEWLRSKESEREEDLVDQGVWCNGCGKVIKTRKDCPFYLCVICTNVDLCTECYNKIQASNQGREWKEWQTVCGMHHRYVGPFKN